MGRNIRYKGFSGYRLSEIAYENRLPGDQVKTLCRQTRLKHGLNLGHFSYLLGIQRNTLQQWELGKRIPGSATRRLLQLVAKQLDESLSKRLKLEEKRKKEANRKASMHPAETSAFNDHPKSSPYTTTPPQSISTTTTPPESPENTSQVPSSE